MWRKILALVILSIIGITWLGWKFSDASASRDFARFTIKEKTYIAVVSNTPAQIQQGLSGRQEIGADAMLFVFAEPGRPPFWMIDMRFPLDFIWIYQGVVVDLHTNVPVPSPGATPSQIPTVRPASLADSVLEVPAGFVAESGVSIGDSVMVDKAFLPGVW